MLRWVAIWVAAAGHSPTGRIDRSAPTRVHNRMADPPRRVLAEVADYSAFLRTVRDRVTSFGITHETLDAISGLQSGYASKILADPPIRRMGPVVLFLVLQSLGLSIAITEDQIGLASLGNRLTPRRSKRVLHRAPRITFEHDHFRRIGRMGAAGFMKLSPAKRSRIARKAALARWRKARAAADHQITHQPKNGIA